MVFGDHVNVGIRLREEGDLNFLLFDDVSGTQRSSAASKATRREQQQKVG